MHPHRRKLRSSHRGSSSAVAVLMALVRIGVPLVLIAGLAYWLLNHNGTGEGRLRVTTSIPGAEILVGGMQTGYASDTTLEISAGRRIVTVRKPGYVSIPEFAVVELARRGRAAAHFVLRPERDLEVHDSIPPLRPVRQEILSTGEPVQMVPPATYRRPRYRSDFVLRTPADTYDDTSPSSAATTAVPVAPEISVPSSEGGQVGLISTQITVSSSPVGAEILVNGEPSGQTTPYTFRGLGRGVYSFELHRDGYIARPANSTVTLMEDFQRELVAFELTADPSVPRPTLVVSTAPLAAGIRIDGQQVGVGKVSLEPDYGPHRVEFAEVPGYRTPAPQQVNLTSGQPQAEVVGAYERLVGNAYLAIVPDEGVEKFDGSLLRVFVDNELILDNPKQRFDATLLGRILSGKRTIRVQYGDLSGETTVNLLDGEVNELTLRIESFFSKRKLRLREKSAIPLEQWQQRASKLNVYRVT